MLSDSPDPRDTERPRNEKRGKFWMIISAGQAIPSSTSKRFYLKEDAEAEARKWAVEIYNLAGITILEAVENIKVNPDPIQIEVL